MNTDTFDLEQLKTMMRGMAGVPEVDDLDGDILDRPFGELGYDSLAVLDIATRIQQDFDMPVPDDDIERMTTPRAVIDYVNQRRAGV